MSGGARPLLTRCRITEEVFRVCSTHALCTVSLCSDGAAVTLPAASQDREEIMGLLLGDVKREGKEELTCEIWGLSIQARSDKRKDRVEVSPEQQTNAAVEADELGQRLRVPTRVTGWYHSHPQITVEPSHVDLATQLTWQHMDASFVGLIFSCFTKASSKPTSLDRFRVIAFQAVDTGSAEMMKQNQMMEIPLEVVPTSSIFKEAETCKTAVYQCLLGLVRLQRIMLQEEKTAFTKAMESARPSAPGKEATENKGAGPAAMDESEEGEGEGKAASVHPLTQRHHSAVFEQALVKLLEYQSFPAVQAAQQMLCENKAEVARLRARKEELAREKEALLKRLQERQQQQQKQRTSVPSSPSASTAASSSSSSSSSSSAASSKK